MNLNVICVKWGNKFASDYVRKLYNMVNRNLTLPYRFVCLTDNPADLSQDIKIIRLEQNFEYCWNKLELFRPEIFSEEELCLYFDLDVVITNNIDDLVTYKPEEKFIGVIDWYDRRHTTYNSSVMRFFGDSITALNTLLITKLTEGKARWDREYDGYLHSNDKVVLLEGKKRYGGDQEWISNYFYSQNKLKHHSFPDGWIMSYKKHGTDGILPGCKVLVFHGYPKPHEVYNNYVVEHWR